MIINMLNNLILFRYQPMSMRAWLTANACVSTTKRMKPRKSLQNINIVKEAERYGSHYMLMVKTTPPIDFIVSLLSKRRPRTGYIASRYKYIVVWNE